MPRRVPVHLIVAALLLLAANPARADARLSVEVGWGNAYRAGRWNPIYVTAESSPPREVVATIEGPHNAPHALVLQSRFALSPVASTHAAYFPLGEGPQLQETVLTLRDGATMKRIAGMTLALNPPLEQAPLGQPLIGVSGDKSTFGLLKDQFAGDATVGYIPPSHLPVVAAGYDALDVLVLNAPDLSRVADDQQRAIVEWLRAGGTLVLWPGTYDTPDAGPLIDVLPARIGENRFIDTDPAAVERAGLTAVAKVRGRQLTPGEDAEAIALLGPQMMAYRRAVGFGQVVMAPADLATFRFQSEDAVRAFWAPVLQGVPERMRDHAPDATITRWLRDAPAGRFGAVPGWLLVALVIVGPLDSLLLRVLGRRPWTVTTVIGWAGLIATLTYHVRERNRERPAEYRTVRVIDEVDRAAAVVTDFASVRAPAGAATAFPEERGAWWQPAVDPTDPPTAPRSEFHVAQHEGGTWPTVLPARVRTPRVLAAHRWTAAPSLIDAALSLKDGRVTGSVTNRGDRALTNVHVRLAGGVARINVPAIAPGAAIDVDAALDAADRSLDIPPPESSYEARRASDAPVLPPDYAAVEGSTFARSMRIAELLSRGGRACVYAEVQDPAPPTDLPPPVNQKHKAFLRSLVRLK